MTKKAKKPVKPVKKDPVARAIAAKERAIANGKKRQDKARAWAADECADIQKQINKSKVLLEALKRGELKP